MNHTDEVLVPGASLDASKVIRSVLASMIAGITTELKQVNDLEHIDVSITPVETGLKFTFTLPTMDALATAIQADIVMSSVSMNPVQNKVIKAYVDGKFWSGTTAEYAELANKTDIICFITDTNIVMYNSNPYSIHAHTHGNLTYAGAIGTLSGLVVMTGTDGVLEAVTTEALKELLGASSGVNLLHNGEFASPFNTGGLTIYNTVGECIDRWSLLGGTLTLNAGHATLSQTSANNARLKQVLPTGSYQRLLGQTLTLSVLLDDDETVYQGSGVINGAATTIMTVNLLNGYTVYLVVDNTAKSAYVEIKGGATAVAAIDMLRVKLEIGSTASIVEGVTDVALDYVRIKAYDVTGSVRVIATPYIRYDAAMTLTPEERVQARTNMDVPAVADVPTTPAEINAAAKSVLVAIVLDKDNWSTNSYTLTSADAAAFSAITAATAWEVLPGLSATDAEIEALQDANLLDGGQAAGSITIRAKNGAPTIDVPIRIIIRGDLY